MSWTERPDPGRDELAAAFARLLEAAALPLARMVWSAEGLPMAERIAAAWNRVRELAEGRARAEVGDVP